MKGSDLLRIVDQMQHEKNIDREIIFSGIEAALRRASLDPGTTIRRGSLVDGERRAPRLLLKLSRAELREHL